MRNFTLIVFAFMLSATLAAQSWNFSTDGDAEGWTAIGNDVLSVQNGMLNVTVDYWEGPRIKVTGLNLSAGNYSHVLLKMRGNAFSGEPQKKVRVFWNNPFDPARLVISDVTISNTELVSYLIRLDDHSEWTGTITDFRLDLCYGGGQNFDIDLIKLIGAPVVTVSSAISIQKGEQITASSTEDGKIFLVPSGTNAVLADIEAAAGTNVMNVQANTEITLESSDLAIGSYVIYALSADGLLSDASEVITVTEATTEATDAWYFDTAGDTEGWVAVGNDVLAVENGNLKVTVDYWEGPRISITGLNLPAEDYSHLLLKMRGNAFSGEPQKKVRIFWNNPFDPARLVIADVTINQADFSTYAIKLGDHAQWNGTITDFRLDICYGGGQDFDVDFIKLVKAPAVTVSSASQVQKGEKIVAKSSEDGKLYLVPAATNPVVADIETAAGTNVIDVQGENEVNFSTDDLTIGDYVVYAVSSDGLLSSASKTITITEVVVLTYSVTFIVNDGTSPIEGAVVSFDGTNVTTGSDGKALFSNVPANTYAYSVSASEYLDGNGTVTVTDADIEETVSLALIPKYTVSFVIDDGSSVIEGAVVNFNGQELTTGFDGLATFSDLLEGDYNYTVTAYGFLDKTGTISITDQNIQEQISMELNTGVVEWYFDQDDNSEGWVPNSPSTTSLAVKDGILTAYSNEWHGPEIRIFNLEFLAAEYPMLEIKIKTRIFAEAATKNIRVFWNNPDAARSIIYPFTANADEFQTLQIDMSGHAEWKDTITDIRLDVCYGHGKEIDIDYIKMIKLVGVNPLERESFTLYPNPASGFVNIKGNWSNSVNYRVISVSGEVVRHGSLMQGSQVIDLKGLSQGIYFMKVENHVLKLVVR